MNAVLPKAKMTLGVRATCALLCGASLVSAADWPQWRGPNRDGISSETGLLKEWPKEGPKRVWQINHLGGGYGTPSVVGGRIYVMANQGIEDEFVKALDAKDGAEVWSVRLGKTGNPEQKPSFSGARSTPTVAGDSLYVLSSDGDLAGLDAADGKAKWRRNLRTDFAGKPGIWAYSESPQLDGTTLVCTPGGSEATIVALNAKTGDVLWKCALPEADEAAYASSLVVETGGIRQYVVLLQKGLVGVDAKTGRFLWRFAKPVSKFNANIPTPVAGFGGVFAGSAGTGGGMVKLKAVGGSVEAEPVYFESKLPTAIGGAVVVGDFLYGTGGQALLCANFQTGEVKWEERSAAPGSLCYADGRLYLHSEGGDMALVEATPEGYREHGRFTPPNPPQHSNPMEKAWSYPVIANGRLYLRDLGTLWCFDLR